jgi:hypothetical protein
MSRLGLLRADSLDGRRHRSRSKGAGLRSMSNISETADDSKADGKDSEERGAGASSEDGGAKTVVVHFDEK